jgi:uncharacterized protein YbjT (DUF2867 family)
MREDQTTQVVIGASGGIGSAVTRLLAEQGIEVRAVNRSGQMDVPDGVEIMAADATDPASTRSACEGAFGANPTPHQEAIQRTLEWYKENP